MVCKERAEALIKTIRLSFLTVVYNSPFIIRVSDRLPVTILFFVTILFDVYSQETDHCLSRTASIKKRERLLVASLYVCRVCFGSKNSKDLLFRSIMI